MRVGIVIQTRMGSTRLPGKTMMDLYGKPVIHHVVERIQQCKNVDCVIIATTQLERDDIIYEQSQKLGISCYRGSEDDVLLRYYMAAKENSLDVIVRITSDCPLIDPIITDKVIAFYLNNNYDIVSNAGADPVNRTYPRGLDTEVFSFNMLEKACQNAIKPYQREHVTPYIYENGRVFYYKNKRDFSGYRWTLDTKDDYAAISLIYKYLYYERRKHDFYLEDIIQIVNLHPEISEINEHVKQKTFGTSDAVS